MISHRLDVFAAPVDISNPDSGQTKVGAGIQSFLPLDKASRSGDSNAGVRPETGTSGKHRNLPPGLITLMKRCLMPNRSAGKRAVPIQPWNLPSPVLFPDPNRRLCPLDQQSISNSNRKAFRAGIGNRNRFQQATSRIERAATGQQSSDRSQE